MGENRDPGDAVPPGVAPKTPAPLNDEDKAVGEKLEHLGDLEVGEAERGDGEGVGRPT